LATKPDGGKMSDITLSEAINVIEEYGIDPDGYVQDNYAAFFIGDNEPSDNTLETSQYFNKCLKIVCDYAIKCRNIPGSTFTEMF